MTQPNNEKSMQQLFDSWIEGESLSEQELFQLKMHPEWSLRMQTFERMAQMSAEAEGNLDVPQWDKNAGFEQYLAKPSWWQTQGTATLALCFSIFACVIMLLDVKLVQGEQGMQLAWSEQQQQDVLNQQFVQLAKMNNDHINQRLNEFQQMHKQNTAQLVSYVLDNSRLERKEDIQDMVDMIQSQRNEDLSFLKQQFNDINYNLRLASRRNNRLANEILSPEEQLTEE